MALATSGRVCMEAADETGDKPSKVSVCELLADMQKWNGHLVEVPGKIRNRSFYIWDDCPTEITVQGHRFQNLIVLTDPRPEIRGWTVHQIPCRIDQGSWTRFVEATYRVPSDKTVAMTVVGLFETQLNREQLVRRTDGLPMGFGDQGFAPAQLVIKEIRDIRFVP